MTQSVFTIGQHTIGGPRCFIIAEAGVNHDGNSDKAHALVDAAADAGADCVKFQTFDPAELVSPLAPAAEYQHAQTGSDTQMELLRGLTLPREALLKLQQHATARGLMFLSTPFDTGSADVLESMEVPAFKVPSGELTNSQLVAHLARKGRPLLISTGMATLDEVIATVSLVRRTRDVPIALFHCVSNYPAAAADCNLSAMATLRRATGVPVGWSDHTLDLPITIAAAALGAELIEKHLTLDRSAPGPDHAASLEPEQFASLVHAVHDAFAARGDGIKQPVAAELPIRELVRRSAHLRESRLAGHRLTAEDVVLLRPMGGFPPRDFERLVGRVLTQDVASGSPLTPDNVAT